MQYLKNRRFDKTCHILEAERNESLCGLIGGDNDNRQFYELIDYEPDKVCSICLKMQKFPKADPKQFIYSEPDYQRTPPTFSPEVMAKLDALTEEQINQIFPDDFSRQQFAKGLKIYKEIAAASLPPEELPF